MTEREDTRKDLSIKSLFKPPICYWYATFLGESNENISTVFATPDDFFPMGGVLKILKEERGIRANILNWKKISKRQYDEYNSFTAEENL